MDYIFNELCSTSKASNPHKACEFMEALLNTAKEGAKYGFRKIAFRDDFVEIILADDYTINHWLNDPGVTRIQKNLLLGLKRYPYIDESDASVADEYLKNTFTLQDEDGGELNGQDVEGLAAAYLYDAAALSFSYQGIWDKALISISIEDEAQEIRIVEVRHISEIAHFESHKEWLDENQDVELVTALLEPVKKNIKLSDDHHGNDVLKVISKRLVRSPYVEGVINSLPFKGHEKKFISNVFETGIIEIVLVDTEEGFGVAVQTTGRNLAETKKIAKILENKYG